MAALKGGIRSGGDHVDIFHPLARVEWRKVGAVVPDIHVISPHCVCLKDRVYIVVAETGHSDFILYSFSLDFKEYKRLSLPVRTFAFSHYHSQLVLVGKYDTDDDPSCGDLWVCGDDGVTWQRSLPPLRVRRANVSVVNTGSPEYLVVIGGENRNYYNPNDVVEVLVNGEWFIAEHLPYRFRFPRSYVHNGMLIVISKSERHSYCCSVASLLATCRKSVGSKQVGNEEKQPFEPSAPHLDDTWTASCLTWSRDSDMEQVSKNNDMERDSLWKEFPKSEKIVSLVSFRQQLLAFHEDIVELFCPFTNSWLKVGVISQPPHYLRGWNGFNTVASGVLSNGEVVLMGELGDLVVCSGSLRLSPDTNLSESALHRLSTAGFQLNSTLADLYWEFIEAVGISDVRDKTSLEMTMANIFKKWMEKENVRRPPTWKSLLDILTELGLGELSQQISSYLANGVMSLRDQCMGVVISALLQQRMELDQLSTRFPFYVPSSVRNAILNSFKACTLQLVPFKSLPYRPSNCSSGEDTVLSHNMSNSTSSPFISTVLPPYQNPFLRQGGGRGLGSGFGLSQSSPTTSPFMFGQDDPNLSPPTSSSLSLGRERNVEMASKPFCPPFTQGVSVTSAASPFFSQARIEVTSTFPKTSPKETVIERTGLMGLGLNSLAIPTVSLTVQSSRFTKKRRRENREEEEEEEEEGVSTTDSSFLPRESFPVSSKASIVAPSTLQSNFTLSQAPSSSPTPGSFSSNIFTPQASISSSTPFSSQSLPPTSLSPSLPPQLLTFSPGALSSNIFAPQTLGSTFPPSQAATLPSQSLPSELLTSPSRALSSSILAPQTLSCNSQTVTLPSQSQPSKLPTIPPLGAPSSNLFAPQTSTSVTFPSHSKLFSFPPPGQLSSTNSLSTPSHVTAAVSSTHPNPSLFCTNTTQAVPTHISSLLSPPPPPPTSQSK